MGELGALTGRGFFSSLPLVLLGSYDVPWVPTRRVLIEHILRLAGVGEGTRFYDLGCGDGRVAVEAAKRGAYVYCVEIRGDLIARAMENARRAGVFDRVRFVNKSFFDVEVSDADAVYMYLLSRVNARLRPKLERELRPGARVVTLDFPVEGWKPVVVERYNVAGMTRVLYLYIIGVSTG